MKVAILGASGILGQHLMISVPPGVEAVFTRRTAGPLYEALDVESNILVDWFDLADRMPKTIINLMGENRPDVVEKDPDPYDFINTRFPGFLARWCDQHSAHLIQVSSQAVLDLCNSYAHQKNLAEAVIKEGNANWTIVRPTIVLGIRPFPAIGRENPAERMLSGRETHSVDNRYFAVSFAWDVAELLWKIAQDPASYRGQTIHAGNPERLSRYALAKLLGATPEPVTQEWAEREWGIAPRPLDTSGAYVEGWHKTSLKDGIRVLRIDDVIRQEYIGWRAVEIAAFLKLPVCDVAAKAGQGFIPLHHAVTHDFNESAGLTLARAPKTEAELLNWYRTTESYIWELTAYHCDPGYNYAGKCKGILETLKAKRQERIDAVHKIEGDGKALAAVAEPYRVLCLGDGVGSLTIALKEGGLEPVYHDLAGSRTAAFAEARFSMRFTEPVELLETPDWQPPRGPTFGSYDRTFEAIVSLDYLEHVPNVEEWVRFVWNALKVGGLFCAQNAFGMGSGPEGAIPMHLACNDHWEADWDPFLASIGFRQITSNWYEKPRLEPTKMEPESVPMHRTAEWLEE